jgi:hypothetical protein
VKLGKVDICLEASMMSSHLVLPREGHLEQVFHIFAHLKKYHKTEVVYDPSDPVIDETQFDAKDWASSELGHLDGVEDHEGHNIMLMRDIIDYERDEAMAVPIEDKYLTTKSGQRRLRKTIQGWRFLVNWKVRTESWVKLTELKDSFPIELAEFA